MERADPERRAPHITVSWTCTSSNRTTRGPAGTRSQLAGCTARDSVGNVDCRQRSFLGLFADLGRAADARRVQSSLAPTLRVLHDDPQSLGENIGAGLCRARRPVRKPVEASLAKPEPSVTHSYADTRPKKETNSSASLLAGTPETALAPVLSVAVNAPAICHPAYLLRSVPTTPCVAHSQSRAKLTIQVGQSS